MKSCMVYGVAGIAMFVMLSGSAWSEAPHVWGVHSWAQGCIVDVMHGHTSWTTEFAFASDVPNLPNLERMRGEGFTIIQRLDYLADLNVPLEPSEIAEFAADCARWVRETRQYTRHFMIGNEMEFSGINAVEYTPAFQAAYAAMKAEHSDIIVIIGAFVNHGNIFDVIERVGRDGYDGISIHCSNHAHAHHLAHLAEVNARPEVGMYITEWGWVGSTVPQPIACARMRDFYDELIWANENHLHQIYAVTYYVYHQQADNLFALQSHPIEKYCFAEQAARHTAFNHFIDNAIVISNPRATVGGGTNVEINWQTDKPATTQAFYRVHGETVGLTTNLSFDQVTDHSVALFPLDPGIVYDFVAVSTGWGMGDATSGLQRFYPAPWNVNKTNIGTDRATITWTTPFQGTSVVRYGTTEDLDQTAGTSSSRTTNHSVMLFGLEPDTIYFFKAESDPQQENWAVHESALNAFMTTSGTVPTPTPIPQFCMGDANRDGFVNAEDYRTVRNHFGQQTGGVGDANGDGFVNAEDYRAVRNHFGQSCD